MPDKFGGYNPSAYIKELIEQGVGPTQGLKDFRGDDGEITDSRWFKLFGEVNGLLDREDQILGLAGGSVPPPELYGSFEAGSGGQYVTTVEIQMIDRGTGDWYTQQYQYWTADPHTPEEAQDDAWAMFGDADTESQYEQTMMGAVAVSFWRTTPFGGA